MDALHTRALQRTRNKYTFYRVFVYDEPNQRLKRSDYPTPIAEFLDRHDMRAWNSNTQQYELPMRAYDFPAARYLELLHAIETLQPMTLYAVEITNPLGDLVRRYSRNPSLVFPSATPDNNSLPKHVRQRLADQQRKAQGKLPPLQERTATTIEYEDKTTFFTIGVSVVRRPNRLPTERDLVYAVDGVEVPANEVPLSARREAMRYFGV